MRKNILILTLLVFVITVSHSQTRGVKIGYIDMEYILQNVPDYMEAKGQLEAKAQKWKQEIESLKNEVNTLKESLKTEKVLLTKELIAEREEEIIYQETALLDYQQKRFGPTGDLTIQKAVLTQPIQDQVFSATQDIAEARKYDFIFDKSSDLTMLFAAKRYDISDQVVRVITRATKRNQLTKKQLKLEEAKEAKEDMIDENPAQVERQKILDDKKAAREKLIEERKQAITEKKKAAEETRNKIIEDKLVKKNGGESTPDDKNIEVEPTEKTSALTDDNSKVEVKKKTLEERTQILEERKKALEERRKKIIEDREAAKKAKLEEKNKTN